MARTYLDGNSLGPPAADVRERTLDALDRWSRDLIGGWNDGWLELPARIAEKIADLVGAEADEILVADSTSVNLYKLVSAALTREPGGLVTHTGNFPSDRYVLSGLGDPAVLNRPDDRWPEGATVGSFSHVEYVSGERHDMAALRDRTVVWDLAHSAGAVPLRLSEDAGLAVGCGYKFLNGGPGAPAFLYVRRDLQDELESPIRGWFGADRPFDFSPDYRPAPGIARFAAGTPPILAMVALEAGVDALLEVGMPELWARSVRLTSRLIDGLDGLGLEVVTPRDPERRGSQVSVSHPEAWRISRALVAAGVIPDFRPPSILRFGIAPRWNDEADIDRALSVLGEVIREERWRAFPVERPTVT